MDWREEKILEYIEANPGCTKTEAEVENFDYMGEKKAKKIIKKLIIDDKKVICVIDKVNSQIHHLFINNEPTPETAITNVKNLILSKVEEQMKKQMYTVTRLENGEWIGIPVKQRGIDRLSIAYPTVKEIIDNAIKPAAK